MVGIFTYIGKDTEQLKNGEVYKIDLLDVNEHCYKSKSPILIRKGRKVKRKEKCSAYHNCAYGIGIEIISIRYSYLYRTWTTFFRDWKEDD